MDAVIFVKIHLKMRVIRVHAEVYVSCVNAFEAMDTAIHGVGGGTVEGRHKAQRGHLHWRVSSQVFPGKYRPGAPLASCTFFARPKGLAQKVTGLVFISEDLRFALPPCLNS